MLQKPLVTVIVPVYNNELYIRDCIDALLCQTYPNLQIILVNDGSTDSTYEICKAYQDERILLLSKENGGASSARNMGLKYADGEYIYFADSDDHIELKAIEKLVGTIESVQGDCVFFEADNYTEETDIKIKKCGLLQKTDYAVQSGDELIPQLLRNKDYHAAPFLYFVHRSIYDGLSFEEGIMFEDELFTFQMLKKCKKIVSLREQLYHRRVRSGSVMTAQGKSRFRFCSISKVFTKLLTLYEDDSNDLVLNQYIARIGLLWFGYWKALGTSEKKQNEIEYAKIRKQILAYKGFGSRELVIRCYGYYAWLVYICPGRCIKRIQRRRLR